jgi:CBS domain-containing protein/gamma-glutamyl:cysteine ligase YbdK (ATP-grasp superfamily)
MGQQTAQTTTDRQTAIRWMLRDLQALQQMLRDDRFETGVRRIGAEQEMFLVDASWQPAPGALPMLAALSGQPYTTEVGAFNLELNLDPQEFTGDCFTRVQAQLDELLALGRVAAESVGLHVVLSGTLPTIRKRDLTMANMVQNPRYLALNNALMGLRGEDYELHIKGTDELRVRQDSVMAEACNASFQVHLQVTPSEFANAYNVAQALSGPTLASATNSPLLFGKRLWAETRIALFEQSVDTRRPGHHVRERSARVSFGDGWVTSSVAELYKEDITRYRPVLAPDDYTDPLAELAEGRIPSLPALRLHTGTVWRWNRACYGISHTALGDLPHLRIENRVLPSGPSTLDEVANAALWLGLMRAVAEDHPEIHRTIPFEQARTNFVAAARQGLSSTQTWLDGEEYAASVLTLDVLLPLAARGLEAQDVDEDDIDKYLSIIERRVRSGNTGSRWVLTSLNGLRNQGSAGQRLNSLTAAMVSRQRGGTPVADWSAATLDEGGQWQHNFVTVEQLMTTDIVSVAPDDPVELVANLLDWHRIRQILVEDSDGSLVGLVSYRAILRLVANGTDTSEMTVADVMKGDPVCVPPDMAPLRALELMRQFGIGALPVVSDGHLVGVVTEHDFFNVAGMLLLEQLDQTHRVGES